VIRCRCIHALMGRRHCLSGTDACGISSLFIPLIRLSLAAQAAFNFSCTCLTNDTMPVTVRLYSKKLQNLSASRQSFTIVPRDDNKAQQLLESRIGRAENFRSSTIHLSVGRFVLRKVPICIALYNEHNSPLRRSDKARVNEGSHSLTCHPHVYP